MTAYGQACSKCGEAMEWKFNGGSAIWLCRPCRRSEPYKSRTAFAEEVAHDFLPVAGHPDDDECTYRHDGTDATYCGLLRAEHKATE